MVAALASWLDARAAGGRWLVRIEDVDTPRCVPGAAEEILRQLAACGLVPDDAPWWQSRRAAAYAVALATLRERGAVFDCACSRSDVEAALRARGVAPGHGDELVYPGTCRNGLAGRPARAVRLRVPDGPIAWTDRRLGAQQQDLAREVGDVVLRRADGLFAYQLAVVVDDAAQGVTDIVRGEDLADNTPRQIHLQRCLGLPQPRTLHTPLVRGADGLKLSKQNGAVAVAVADPVAVLRAAGAVLGIRVPQESVGAWLAAAVPAWRAGLA